MGLEPTSQWWADTASGVQSSADDLTREEAREIYAAEAGRIRLADRRGRCTVELSSGQVLVGEIVPSQTSGMIAMVDDRGRRILVNGQWIATVLLAEVGALRDESKPDLASLRSVVEGGQALQVLVSGRWITGHVIMACSDHAVLDVGHGAVCVTYSSAQAWILERV